MPGRSKVRIVALSLSFLLTCCLFGLVSLGCKDLVRGMSMGERLELNQGELYYTKQVDRAAAERLGDHLVAEKYFDGTRKTVQLDKKGSTWLLRLVVKAGMDKDEDYANLVKLFGMQVADGVFSGEPLEIELCDAKLQPLRSVTPLDGRRYEIHGGEIYHASMVDRSMAKKLGEQFVKTGFFDGQPKTVHLLRDDKSWMVRIVVRSGMHEHEQAVREFEVMGLELSGALFDGTKVVIHLCDDKLVTLREVPCPDGKLLVFNGGDLYFASGIEPHRAKKLGDYLVADGFFDGAPKTVRLDKQGDLWRFQMVVKPGVEKDEAFVKLTREVAKELSEKVFDGGKVEIHLCDATLRTLEAVGG
ncbi:MAG: hypothetical protein JRI23_01235 [Deltaproteobacteria bacterium]|jgi:hypothetical protein|nr:hypothetical protein [Deltaproteobacteria bacterium]MBW2530078.1 hypothetical protein [Deltaproteobacteria bacterium]